MQSKMTEREFRERIAASDREAAYLDNAVRVAREAGLEFAPEPKLPERLAIRADLVPCSYSPAPIIAPEDGFFAHPQQRDEAYALAVSRHNAYPGLRAAANALHAEMVKLWPDPCTYGHHLRACLDAVQAALAKGPK